LRQWLLELILVRLICKSPLEVLRVKTFDKYVLQSSRTNWFDGR